MARPLQARQQRRLAAWHGWIPPGLRLLILPARTWPFSYQGEKPRSRSVRCIERAGQPLAKPAPWAALLGRNRSTPAYVVVPPGRPCAAWFDGLGGVEMNLEQPLRFHDQDQNSR